MIERDDELTELLGSIDPAIFDPPPEPDSTRYREIQDTVMANTELPNPTDASSERSPVADNPSSWRRRPLLLVASIAAAAVLLGVVLSVASSSTPSAAAAAVQAAAENSADVTTFRVTFASDDLAFPGGSASAEVDGNDVHMVAGDMEMIRVGDTEWFGQGGEFESGPAEVFNPFGEASAQVVSAALASNQVADEGMETLDGIETTRYRIQIDDTARAALAEVPSRSQYWFTAETSESAEVMIDDDGNEVPVTAGRSGFLEDADSLTIWVADDLIHQIEVSSGSTQFTIAFFDFGADINITPPQ